jgi:DNA primase
MAPETKLTVARDVLPVIHKIKDPLLQDEYLGRLANALRVEKVILGQQMKRMKMAPDERPASTQTVLEKQAVSSSLLSIEEEMILLALHHPSEELGRALERVEWQDKRCFAVWRAARTKLASGTLQIGEVLSAVPEEVREWLTPLALQERQYAQPKMMLEDLAAAWRRQKDSQEWQELKGEIDSMIEGRIPLDAAKVQTYNDLSKRLKGSKPDVNNLREAPLHG